MRHYYRPILQFLAGLYDKCQQQAEYGVTKIGKREPNVSEKEAIR
jgi:hypothetical protein